MFKRLSFFAFWVFIILQASAGADLKPLSIKPIPYSLELKSCVEKILKIPEVTQVIAEIQKEGPIRIAVNNSSPIACRFGAYWDLTTRTVVVAFQSKEDEGKCIGSLLFELHNASSTSKFEHIYYLASIGKLDRDGFVQEIEFQEYQNSKKASELAEKGIRLGIFPPSARLFTYRNFEEHAWYQKKGGHSALLGHHYDEWMRSRH